MGDIRCPECGDKTTLRKSKKDGRKFHVCVDYPWCKGKVSSDEDSGDDRDKEKPVAKTTRDKPLQPREPETAPYLPQYPRAQKRDVASEREKPSGPQQQKGPKPESYRPQYKRPPKSYVASEKKEPLEPQQQKTPKPASFLPLYKRMPKKYVAPDKEETPETIQQVIPKKEVVPEKKEPPKLRQRRVPQGYLAPEKKKRSNIVIIIALVIAFIAIDGMIYAAFVLR